MRKAKEIARLSNYFDAIIVHMYAPGTKYMHQQASLTCDLVETGHLVVSVWVSALQALATLRRGGYHKKCPANIWRVKEGSGNNTLPGA
jgi:hypothetical protein